MKMIVRSGQLREYMAEACFAGVDLHQTGGTATPGDQPVF
jgi:hypothetical protein